MAPAPAASSPTGQSRSPAADPPAAQPRSAGGQPPQIAVEPQCWRREALVAAVLAGGGEVVALEQAQALVWAEPAHPELMTPMLDASPALEWVQLPYAGVESFIEMIASRPNLEWTCGKGVYAKPVAEHVLTLTLAGMRGLGDYAAATTWEKPQGRNLIGARVTVLGAGGITEELIPLLTPFGCEITVLRKSVGGAAGAAGTAGTPGAAGTPNTPDNALAGATVRPISDLDAVLPQTDLLVLALALTEETAGIIAAKELALLPGHAWLINVARGRHIVTDDLVSSLRAGEIGGAGLDVTDPEPLPDGHPLWDFPNCIITPHVANTPAMGLPLLADRVRTNVALRVANKPLIGHVDVTLGY